MRQRTELEAVLNFVAVSWLLKLTVVLNVQSVTSGNIKNVLG